MVYLTLAAALGAVSAGCGEQQAPEAKGKLNVALIIPTTGELSSYGRQCRRGAELARDEVNVVREKARKGDPKAGVPGDVREVPLWLNIRDDSAKVEEARETGEQLYDVARFLAVVGPVAEDSAIEVADVLKDHQVTLVVPTVEAERLRENRTNVVQLSLTSSQQGRLLARFVMAGLRPTNRSALFVRSAGDPEAQATMQGFSNGLHAEDKRLKVAQADRFKVIGARLQSETDDAVTVVIDKGRERKTVVAAVRDERPGVVVAAVGAEGMGALVKRLRQAGETVPVVGGTHAYARGTLARLGLDMGEVYVAAHFAADADERRFPGIKAFVTAYGEASSKAVPGAAAALAYDAVKLVDQALRKAMPGRTDERTGRPEFPTPAEVGAALRAGAALSAAEAAAGPVTIASDGGVSRPLFILRLDEVGAHYHDAVGP